MTRFRKLMHFLSFGQEPEIALERFRSTLPDDVSESTGLGGTRLCYR